MKKNIERNLIVLSIVNIITINILKIILNFETNNNIIAVVGLFLTITPAWVAGIFYSERIKRTSLKKCILMRLFLAWVLVVYIGASISGLMQR